MRVIKIYKYKRADGGITVSPIKPECEYTEMVRLVADEGKVLTNDSKNFTDCVDTDTANGWYEVDEQTEDENYEGEEGTDEIPKTNGT